MQVIRSAAVPDDDGVFRIKMQPKATDNKASLDAYMADFRKNVEPFPFGRNMYIFDKDIILEVRPSYDGLIHLASVINTGDRAVGRATAALRMMLNLADKHNVGIDGSVSPIPGTRGEGRALNKTELTKWYKKLGFTIKHGEMLYTPGSRK